MAKKSQQYYYFISPAAPKRKQGEADSETSAVKCMN